MKNSNETSGAPRVASARNPEAMIVEAMRRSMARRRAAHVQVAVSAEVAEAMAS